MATHVRDVKFVRWVHAIVASLCFHSAVFLLVILGNDDSEPTVDPMRPPTVVWLSGWEFPLEAPAYNETETPLSTVAESDDTMPTHTIVSFIQVARFFRIASCRIDSFSAIMAIERGHEIIGHRDPFGDDSMQRREILRGLILGTPAAAVAVAGVAAAKSTEYVREKSEQSLDTCKRQLDELRERMDRSEASTRKALKVAFALTALSLGIDASALL